MRKTAASLLMIFLVIALVGCGKSDTVKKVEEAITAIGEVNEDSGAVIKNAESLYDVLTDKEKEKVENRVELVNARSTYDALIEQKAAEELKKQQEEEEAKQQEIQQAAEAEAKKVIAAFNEAEDLLDFVQKYAGNVNGNGSMKFADSFLEDIKTCFDEIDMDAFAAGFPDAAGPLGEIIANCDTVHSLLVEMGNSNSDRNVGRMKELCASTIALMANLKHGELREVTK